MTATVLLLASFVTIQAPEGENLYRAVKVGDWLEYKSKDVVMRHTAVAKTDDSLTIRIDQTIGGEKSNPYEYKIDLKKPYPPEMPADPNVDIKQEKLGSGMETLTIDGKKYDCTWTKTKSTFNVKFDGKTMTSVYITKAWSCKDIPLGGSVKTETEVMGMTHVTELSGYGRGK